MANIAVSHTAAGGSIPPIGAQISFFAFAYPFCLSMCQHQLLRKYISIYIFLSFFHFFSVHLYSLKSLAACCPVNPRNIEPLLGAEKFSHPSRWLIAERSVCHCGWISGHLVALHVHVAKLHACRISADLFRLELTIQHRKVVKERAGSVILYRLPDRYAWPIPI